MYWVQGKAPAGNWYDALGTDDLAFCERHAAWMRDEQEITTRVVKRYDQEIMEFTVLK